MQVPGDGHAVFDSGNQAERRFSATTKAGPSAVLFIGDRHKERRAGSGTKAGPSAILFEGDNREERDPESDVKRHQNLPENNRWLLAGQVVLIAAVIIGWRIVTEQRPDIIPLHTPGTAETTPSAVTQLHKDLRDLMFLPHYGLSFAEVKHIYSEQEVAAIEKIGENFR